MFVGSPSDPVVYTRIALFEPAVMSFLPLGVYVREVGPGGSGAHGKLGIHGIGICAHELVFHEVVVLLSPL